MDLGIRMDTSQRVGSAKQRKATAMPTPMARMLKHKQSLMGVEIL
jgi:hypothetical protein